MELTDLQKRIVSDYLKHGDTIVGDTLNAGRVDSDHENHENQFKPTIGQCLREIGGLLEVVTNWKPDEFTSHPHFWTCQAIGIMRNVTDIKARLGILASDADLQKRVASAVANLFSRFARMSSGEDVEWRLKTKTPGPDGRKAFYDAHLALGDQLDSLANDVDALELIQKATPNEPRRLSETSKAQVQLLVDRQKRSAADGVGSGTKHKKDSGNRLKRDAKKELVVSFIRERQFSGTLEELRTALKNEKGFTVSVSTLQRYGVQGFMPQGNPHKPARRTGRDDPTRDSNQKVRQETEAVSRQGDDGAADMSGEDAYTMPDD